MRIIKHILIALLLFFISFSIVFFRADKTEYYTEESWVEEPRVYVTEYGHCYHSCDCHYISRSWTEKGIYYARSKGYRACSYCKGTPNGTIQVNYYKTEEKDITNEAVSQSISFAFLAVAIYTVVCVIICICEKKQEDVHLFR